MKFQCIDGESREFELLRDKLIRVGFDPVLLDNDDGLISTSLPPNTSLFEALRFARDGINLPSYIYHWSKRSKKINPISIPLNTLLNDAEWLAFLPSIEVDKETSLFGKHDLLTWSSRLLTKVFRISSRVKDSSSFRKMIFGENIDKFQFNCGYRILGLQTIEKAREEFLLLRDSDESVIAIHPSLLGYTNKVMIALK